MGTDFFSKHVDFPTDTFEIVRNFLATFSRKELVIAEVFLQRTHYRHDAWFFDQLVRRLGGAKIVLDTNAKIFRFCHDHQIAHEDFREMLFRICDTCRSAARSALPAFISELSPQEKSYFSHVISAPDYDAVVQLRSSVNPECALAFDRKMVSFLNTHRVSYNIFKQMAHAYFFSN